MRTVRIIMQSFIAKYYIKKLSFFMMVIMILYLEIMGELLPTFLTETFYKYIYLRVVWIFEVKKKSLFIIKYHIT